MPQTSTDWAFWGFTTLFLGFILNLAAGVVADPISEIFARWRSRKPITTRSKEANLDSSRPPDVPDGLSKEIDIFLQDISNPWDVVDHDNDEDVLASPRKGLSNSEWWANTVLLSVLLVAEIVFYLENRTPLLQAGILFAYVILLVASLVSLVKYIRQRVDYKTRSKYQS